MKLTVTVKPNARENTVEKIAETTYKVSVTAVPAEGKANKQVIELLAEHFDVPKSSVYIHSGAAGRKKIIEIDYVWKHKEKDSRQEEKGQSRYE